VHDTVWIYFVVLIILTSFFAVNLALAVLYLQFTQSQAELEVEREGDAAAAPAGLPIEDAAMMARRELDSERRGIRARLQRLCFWIQESRWSDGTTMLVIACNTLLMSSEHYTMSNTHAKVSGLPLLAWQNPAHKQVHCCFAATCALYSGKKMTYPVYAGE
jgi:hypothetical protein